MADDDDYMGGSTHLKNYMSEGQTSLDKGSIRDTGNAMLRDRQRSRRGDEYYEQKDGKSMGTQLEMGPEQNVNRSRKGNKG